MNQEQLLEQRYARLQKMGYKGPVGNTPVFDNQGNIISENVNGQAHSPLVRRAYGDVLSGQYRSKYKEMFSRQSSSTGPQAFKPIRVNDGQKVAEENKIAVEDVEKLVGQRVDRSKDSELSAIEKMFDPDMGGGRGLKMNPMGQVQQDIEMGDYGPSWNALSVGAQLKNRLQQKQQANASQMEQWQQPKVPNSKPNTLSYRDFASDREAFASTVAEMSHDMSEPRTDYKAYQNYMYHMNEQIIREIAEEIAANTVKSVLAEHIKTERSKYVFEKTKVKTRTGVMEVLKKDDKLYDLCPIKAADGSTVFALKELKFKLKKA